MAKLKAPLFSFGASGKLAGALVYMSWKGLNTVREYVIPSNPQTTAQTTHRAYLTDAVAMVHTAQARAANALTSADQVAYSALASIGKKVMTWFNQVVKLWVDVKVAGDTPIVYSDGVVANKDITDMDISLRLNEETGSTLLAGKFYFGTSKTNLIHSEVATITAGSRAHIDNVDASAYLTVGTKYYWQFRPDALDPCEGADSGIYYFVAE